MITMAGAVEAQEPEEMSGIDVEELAERDFELFKKNLDEIFSEQD